MVYRRLVITAVAGLGLAPVSIAPTARAQALAKPARILVGFQPGGAPDIAARLIADQLKGYAPSIIVDNHPGAGGRLALEALKTADADGTVLCMTPGDQLTVFPHVYKTLKYDPLLDFVPVTTVCTAQFVFVVGPMVPARVATLADFIGWCRVNPKLATFGSPGAGTLPHFLGSGLAREAGVELVHLPYKGGAAAIQDLLAGQLPAAVFTLAAVLGPVQSGSLRVLATTAPKRSPLLAGIQTVREAGYPALEGLIWFGILVPARTPINIVATLNTMLRQVLQSEAVKAGLARQSLEVASSTPSEFAELLKSDTARWGELVNKSAFAPLE